MNTLGRAEEAFAYPWFSKRRDVDMSRERMMSMGERLWDESSKLLELHAPTQ